MIDALRETEEIQRRMRDKGERDFERFQAAADQRARDRFLRFQEQQLYDQRSGNQMAIFRMVAVILVGLFLAVGFVVVRLLRLMRR